MANLGRKQLRKQSIEELLTNLTELVRDQTIVQLGLAGVPQQQIREIVKSDIVKVNKIVKRLRKAGGIYGEASASVAKSRGRR